MAPTIKVAAALEPPLAVEDADAEAALADEDEAADADVDRAVVIPLAEVAADVMVALEAVAVEAAVGPP